MGSLVVVVEITIIIKINIQMRLLFNVSWSVSGAGAVIPKTRSGAPREPNDAAGSIPRSNKQENLIRWRLALKKKKNQKVKGTSRQSAFESLSRSATTI